MATLAPLAAAKRGGRKLGTAASVETAARARAVRSEQASKANATTRAVIAEIQRAGKAMLAAIAQKLEARGVRTLQGATVGAPAQVSCLKAFHKSGKGVSPSRPSPGGEACE